MVKLFSQLHTFRHPWSTTSSAFWRKYPNPFSTHIQQVDCFERKVDAEGKLVVKRILVAETQIPAWMQKLGVSNCGYGVETTIVCPKTQTMVIKSKNVTGASVLTVEETCTYRPHPENGAEWTEYKQEAEISSFMPLFASKFENWSFATITNRSQQGLVAVEALCQRVQKEGVSALASLVDNLNCFTGFKPSGAPKQA
jgi:nicotinic acid phosphoribosyltransferase